MRIRPGLTPEIKTWREKNRAELEANQFALPADREKVFEFFAFLVICVRCGGLIDGRLAHEHRKRCLF